MWIAFLLQGLSTSSTRSAKTAGPNSQNLATLQHRRDGVLGASKGIQRWQLGRKQRRSSVRRQKSLRCPAQLPIGAIYKQCCPAQLPRHEQERVQRGIKKSNSNSGLETRIWRRVDLLSIRSPARSQQRRQNQIDPRPRPYPLRLSLTARGREMKICASCANKNEESCCITSVRGYTGQKEDLRRRAARARIILTSTQLALRSTETPDVPTRSVRVNDHSYISVQ